MAIDDLRLAIRRHPVALAAILLAVTALAAARLGERPPSVPVATTKVVVLPDPRAPVSTATPVLPAYQTFGTKVGSIETGPVLRRAARIALGELAFTSPELLRGHFRSAIAAGVAAARDRFGVGEEAVEALARELARSLAVTPVARKQIVEIRVRGASAAEAAFLSWAVAEAAHQHHGDRMRREAGAVLARLETEAELARARLVEAIEHERSAAAPALGRLEARGRILATLATRLDEEETRLRVAAARHRLGLPLDALDPLAPSAAYLLERHRVSVALATARFDRIALSASLSTGHPDLARQDARVRTIEARLARFDAAGNTSGERRRAERLRRDRFELAIERSVLAERRERLAEETATWRRELALAERAGEESAAIRREMAELSRLERRVRWFAEGLGSPIVLLSPATGAFRPADPPSRGLLLGLLLGVAIVAILAGATFLERWREVLRGRRDVEERLGVPLLGVIPPVRASLADPETADDAATSGIAALAASLCDGVRASERRVLAVTSAAAGEGSSSVAIELAAALARRGRRVAIVDGDLREPAIAARLGLPPGPGLASCLVGAGAEEPGLEEMFETALPGLHAATSAPLPGDRLAVLDPARVGELLGALAGAYDHVIVDTPAIARAGDALAIGSAVDGVLLVAASHLTPSSQVAEARRLLESAGGKVLGAVLAGFPSSPAAAFSLRADGELPPAPTGRIRRTVAV